MPAKVAISKKYAGKEKTVAGIQKNKTSKKDTPSKMSANKRNLKVPTEDEESDSDSGSDLGSDIKDLEDESLDDDVTSDDEPEVTTPKKKPKQNPKKETKPVEEEEIPREYPEKTIFVGNLPKTVEKKFLLKTFGAYGKISTIRLRSAPLADTRVPKRVAVIRKNFHPDRTNINAYIVYNSVDGANRALEANGCIIEERHIRVAMLKDSNIDNRKAIFLGNVPFGADEEQLHKVFESCGKITNVRIIRNQQQGIGKGFAYVNFATTEAVELALLKNGAELDKRKLRVSRCKEVSSRGKRQASTAGAQKTSMAMSGSRPKDGKKGKKGNSAVPYQGQKTDEGKVQKKKKKQKANPQKQAAVETLAKSMAQAGKKNKKQKQ